MYELRTFGLLNPLYIFRPYVRDHSNPVKMSWLYAKNCLLICTPDGAVTTDQPSPIWTKPKSAAEMEMTSAFVRPKPLAIELHICFVDLLGGMPLAVCNYVTRLQETDLGKYKFIATIGTTMTVTAET